MNSDVPGRPSMPSFALLYANEWPGFILLELQCTHTDSQEWDLRAPYNNVWHRPYTDTLIPAASGNSVWTRKF